MNKLTEEDFARAMPKSMKTFATPERVKRVNKLLKDPLLRENYIDNLVSYTSVLAEGRYRTDDYINAVRYVSFKMMGETNISSYVKTFPKRYKKFLKKNMLEKHIHAISSAYQRTQLVQKIFEQTMIPVHIMNADMFQKALNVQAELMITASSDFVRSNAANSIMNILKPPETQKVELDIGLKDDSSIRDLKQTMLELAAMQQKNIETGVQAVREVAHSKLLIESEVVEAEVVG